MTDPKLSVMGDPTAKQQWLAEKKGCFGASSMHALTIAGNDETTGKPTTFGKGAITYIEEKAKEEYLISMPPENGAMPYEMKMGLLNEPIAAEHYRKLIGVPTLRYLGHAPYFKKWTTYSGASSDIIAPYPQDDLLDIRELTTVSFGAELKCPTWKMHGKYLLKIKDQWDLKKIEPEYYTQVQVNLFAWKADMWHWCSFCDEYPFNGKMLIIEVKRDKALETDLYMRVRMAEKIKMEIYEQLKNRS